jgi:hypothetical protein
LKISDLRKITRPGAAKRRIRPMLQIATRLGLDDLKRIMRRKLFTDKRLRNELRKSPGKG